MTHLTPAAHAAFARQHGVASVRQLLAAGLTRRQIERLEQVRAIELVLRGVYRTRSVHLDELGRCAAVCLTRDDLSIAGPTAGRLWNFRRLPRDGRIHVLVPPASQPAIASWVKPYRTAAVHVDDFVERQDGIRLTSRARTAFDLARHLHSDDLLSVMEQAMHDGRLDDEALRRVAIDWMSPRRPWARQFLLQLDRRVTGGAAESHPEVVVAQALRNAGVRGLVRQYELTIPEYGPARFDLALPTLRWAIEIDIHPVHDETVGRLRDLRRDAAATGAGWTTSRLDQPTYDGHLPDWAAQMAVRWRDLRASRAA